LFETRVGRRLLVSFLLAAGIPITAMALISHRHVVAELEAQALDRLDRAAKSAGMTIGSRLLALKSVLQLRADVVAALPPGIDLGPVATDTLPGFEQVTLGSGGNHGMESTAALAARLEAGAAVLHVTRGGRLVLGVSVDGRTRVLWGIVDPVLLWAGPEEGATLADTDEFCVLDHFGAPRTCTMAPAGVLASAAEGTGEHQRHLRWTSDGRAVQGSAWELFLGYEFGVPAWRVVVAQPRASMLAPIAGFTRTFAAVLGLTFFLVLGLVAYLLRHSLVPLRRLSEATGRLAARELGHRVTTRRRGRDEFDDVADSFNLMAGELEQHIGSLRAINALDRAILSTLDRADVTCVVLAHAMECAQADVVALGLAPSEEAGAPWQVSVQRRGAPSLDPVQVILGGPELPHLGAVDTVVPIEADLLRQLGWIDVESGWLMPAREHGRPVGVLFLGYRSRTRIDDEVELRLRHLLDQAAVAVQNVRLVEELSDLQRGALLALAGTIDAKSSWTAGHSERVTATAVALGRWMKLPEPDLERLYRGGLLHDIGKIAIPIDVLDKPSRLTPTERELIETHPTVGARILAPVKPFADVIGIVRSHHERWDGLGYPDRLSGEEIPFLARVLTVADVFDAVSSARPYRAATPRSDALDMIRSGIGSMFDPRVAKAFLAMMASDDDPGDPGPDGVGHPDATRADTCALATAATGQGP
jgi:putative nucleotidyltransferase with HDIG domain